MSAGGGHWADPIRTQLAQAAMLGDAMRRDDTMIAALGAVVDAVVAAFRAGGKVLLCGNGGSAAQAQHIAAEFVGTFRAERPPLPAVALTTDTSVMTAVGNDITFEAIFASQIEALGRPGDVLIGISTSGTSRNVIRALETANDRGLVTVALTGAGDGDLHRCADYCLRVPSDDTPRVQEGHVVLGHVMCELVEAALQRKMER